ncbi:MAG TPA: 2'-5' RNA ligase family protein [Chitinophagaceae bacterium]|jgi:2'-5' RNA ligase
MNTGLGQFVQEYISPSAEFCEYLLVAHPPQEVNDQLKEEKEIFSSRYKVGLAKKTLPHITVANFLAKEEMEETIIRYMRRIFSMQTCFWVTLNNYSGFPEHTVFARVQDHEPFKQLATALKVIDQYIGSNGCPPVKLITHPHLSIARRLQQNVYERAMFEYSRKTFYASFEVNELILLRRKNHYDACTHVNVFQLPPESSLFN